MSFSELLTICVTVLLLARMCLRALVEVRLDATAAQVAVANTRHRAAQLQGQAAAAVSELAGATRALRTTAEALQQASERRAPGRIGQRVTVHTKQPDDHTIHGVIRAEYADRIVLEHAEYVTGSGPRPLPGVVHVEKREVAWIDSHGDVTAPNPAEANA